MVLRVLRDLRWRRPRRRLLRTVLRDPVKDRCEAAGGGRDAAPPINAAAAVMQQRGATLMHPRNKYFNAPPDFSRLARLDAGFAYHVMWKGGSAQLDWGSEAALVELCRALLLHDFGVRWTLPAGRLIPTVPSRLNYLLWVEDLLALRPGGAPVVRGVDVGTGASCIYPLLGCAALRWTWIATELDPASVDSARLNVSLNGWEQKIEVREVEAPSDGAAEAPVLAGVLRPDEACDFVLCNPPFYDVDEAAAGPAAGVASCGGTSGEQRCAGGEVGFVLRMIDDSAALRGQVRWYTSLLGRKASLKPLLAAAHAAGACHVTHTEIAQGNTSRWALGWSFVADAAPPPAAPRAAKAFAVAPLDDAELRARLAQCLREASFLSKTKELREASPRIEPATATEATAAVGAPAAEVAGGSGRKRAAASSPPPPGEIAHGFRFEVRRHASAPPSADAGAAADAAAGGCWIEVVLLESRGPPGAATAAFWRFAHGVRNDVVRDTRRWRRQAQKEA